MGFPVELFVDQPVDEEFICSICHDVLQDPVMVNSGCEHVFCRNCIKDWNSKSPDNNNCPLDRKQVRNLIAPPRLLITLHNRLKLQCQFKERGCKEIHTIEGISDHERACKLNPDCRIDCAGGCGAKITGLELEQGAHQCIEYLKKQVEQLTLENIDLKKQFGVVDENINDEGTRPDALFAVCIFEHSKSMMADYIQLQLGESVEVRQENFGGGTHLGIKNGVTGLLQANKVRIITYAQLNSEREIAQCTRSMSFPESESHLLSFKLLDVVHIIFKDIEHWEPYRSKPVIRWLVELNGKIGYIEPYYVQIVKKYDIIKP